MSFYHKPGLISSLLKLYCITCCIITLLSIAPKENHERKWHFCPFQRQNVSRKLCWISDTHLRMWSPMYGDGVSKRNGLHLHLSHTVLLIFGVIVHKDISFPPQFTIISISSKSPLRSMFSFNCLSIISSTTKTGVRLGKARCLRECAWWLVRDILQFFAEPLYLCWK